MNRFQMISAEDNVSATSDPQQFLQNNQGAMATDLRKEISGERIKNGFFDIEKACLDEKVKDFWSELW